MSIALVDELPKVKSSALEDAGDLGAGEAGRGKVSSHDETKRKPTGQERSHT